MRVREVDERNRLCNLRDRAEGWKAKGKFIISGKNSDRCSAIAGKIVMRDIDEARLR